MSWPATGPGHSRTETKGEGRPIPIVWGTCKLQGPMVAWYGDLTVSAMKKKVKTGIFSSEKVTTGYKYYLGMQLVFCSGELDSIETYVGTSPYIKNVAAIVKPCPNGLGLGDGHHDISGDANPACMIYELLTRPLAKNGLGLSEGLIDLESFREAGDTLAQEGLGLSMAVDQATSCKNLIGNILQHIDAAVYQEPSTGLLVLKLIRFDYSVNELPVLDTSNCVVKSYARPSWSDLKNTVRVKYVDRADGFTEKTVQAQDLAAIEISSGEVSIHEVDLPGLTNATNAQQAVARLLVARQTALWRAFTGSCVMNA
jgi:hypothetical protein